MLLHFFGDLQYPSSSKSCTGNRTVRTTIVRMRSGLAVAWCLEYHGAVHAHCTFDRRVCVHVQTPEPCYAVLQVGCSGCCNVVVVRIGVATLQAL